MASPRAETRAPGRGHAAAGQHRGIRFDKVSKVFPSRAGTDPFLAVRDVDLTIDAGRFVCLIGPSGSGKSTLLNMTAGLYPVTHGKVYYNDEPVRGAGCRPG